jgi:hypothetical protein
MRCRPRPASKNEGLHLQALFFGGQTDVIRQFGTDRRDRS